MHVLHDDVQATYVSTVFFMIVSLPADAADTICCSIDLFILAVSDYIHVTINETVGPWKEKTHLPHGSLLYQSGLFGWNVPLSFFWVRSSFSSLPGRRSLGLKALGLALNH